MIVVGVILILVGYLLPVPAIIATIGWILLVIGVVSVDSRPGRSPGRRTPILVLIRAVVSGSLCVAPVGITP